MWLPASIYEKIPHFWFLAGILFLSVGMYLGFRYQGAIWYIGLGFACCTIGFCVLLIRLRHREESGRPDASADAEK